MKVSVAQARCDSAAPGQLGASEIDNTILTSRFTFLVVSQSSNTAGTDQFPITCIFSMLL